MILMNLDLAKGIIIPLGHSIIRTPIKRVLDQFNSIPKTPSTLTVLELVAGLSLLQLSDLLWWEQRLKTPLVTRSIRNLGPPRNIGLYVDASTSWGIGIVAGDCWAAFCLKEGWKQPGQGICFLKMLAIELLSYYLNTLILGHFDVQNSHLVLCSDNKGTIGAIMKGRSQNHHINYIIQHLWDMLLDCGIAPLLRGILGNPAKHLPLSFTIPAEVAKVVEAVRSTLAPATKSSYGSGILRLSQFCDEHRIREEQRMPASYALLSAFVGTYKGRVAGSTVRGWMSGLHAWHLINHVPWHGDDKWVELAHSAANKEGAAHKQAPCSPISIKYLTVLKAHLDLSNPFHATVWAVATITFFSTSSNPPAPPSIDRPWAANQPLSASRGPRQQPTKAPLWSSPPTIHHDPLCPCNTLRNHLDVNDMLPPLAPLFAFKEETSWSMMMRDWFLSFIFGIWKRAGLYHISGHSF
ncbi:hypothetical protein EST38_g1487 [Candolleomyces aberdarensis]|uniref:Uncharacterized protein n=1 Tax=Candolleomyces aberdarensis TaxID=2316362 RepID=A0A4Q2DZ99_9AGAR|nr:hypothetical protein EST38_g1487 [Candolleomyces aberdarensis]